MYKVYYKVIIFRAGGKHNDLDDVGTDTYHQTMFEMLGNWSFGSYFKEDAIRYAWNLLVEVYRLDPERLYITYFSGDESEPNIPCDTETLEIWKRYVPKERILPFKCKDNFWEMASTGPCGPCTEIHYDRIGSRDASKLVNNDDPSVVELWNLVFIQYNRKETGLERLSSAFVDTGKNKKYLSGMGLERIASILQGFDSNYDSDNFQIIFKGIYGLMEFKKFKYTGKIGQDDKEHIDEAFRVIADHIRTLSIAIAEGVYPSNEGRGYVLRRILRRAVHYGNQILGIKGNF